MTTDPKAPDSFPLRPFPDRAIRWLLDSPANLRGLLLAAHPEIAARIDFGRVEAIPATFVLESFRAREADVVRRAPYRAADGSERDVWVYVLVEHQSAPDRLIPFRVLLAMAQIWERQRREQAERNVPEAEQRLAPILPVVFYTGERPWASPGRMEDLVEVPEELRPFLPRHDMVFLNVRGAPEERLAAGGDVFGWVLRLFRAEDEPLEALAAIEREMAAALRDLAGRGEGERVRVLVRFAFGWVMHRRPTAEHGPLVHVLEQELKSVVGEQEIMAIEKTYADELIEQGMAQGLAKGLAKGLAEGRAEGELEGRKKALIRLLRIRFGERCAEIEASILALNDSARIDELLVRVLDARSLADLGLGNGGDPPG